MRTLYQFLTLIISSVLLSSCFTTWDRGYDYDEYGYYHNHFRGGDYYYTTPPPPPPTYGMPMGTGGHFASPSRSKSYVVSGGNGRSVQPAPMGNSRNQGNKNNGYGNGRTNNTGTVTSTPSVGNSQQPSTVQPSAPAISRRSMGNFQRANSRNSSSSTTTTNSSESSSKSSTTTGRSHTGGGGMRR